MMTTNLANAEPVNARLLDVATGKIPHLYAGLCPDINASPSSRDPDCPACQVISAAESAPKAVEMMERLAQQQAGTHPAPCARSCEANAYEIQIRQLSAERDALAAKLAEMEGQEPVGEVTHSDVRPDSDGMYRHEFLSSFRIGAQAELYACPVRARTKPIYTNGDRDMTMKDRCFTVDENGFISDNNFDFDAGMRVSGDFVGDEKKRYAEMIAAVLNTHTQPVNARLLDALKYAASCLGTDGNDPIDLAIARAEFAPKAARLTADEQRLICDRWADEDGATGQTGRSFLARAIETAVLRKNGFPTDGGDAT